MNVDIKGTVTLVGDTQTVGQKGFQKRAFVVKTDERYPQELEIEATRDRMDELESLRIGDEVSVDAELRGRRWDGPNGTRYFVSLELYKLNVTKHSDSPKTAQEDDIAF
jgi:hypothetical protein